MKYRLSVIGVYLLIFLCAFIFSFIGIFSLVNIFIKFNWLVDSIGLWISVVGSLITSIAVLIYSIIRFNSDKKTKFSNWIAMNYPRLILYYVISSICFGTIKNEIIFTIEELRDLIALEWSIFGIIITIFLVWNVIIVEYLKRKKPASETSISPIKRWQYLEDKGNFFQSASTDFNSIPLLTIDVIILIIATVSTYISSSEVNLFNQNLAVIAFYFTSNTLLEFFLSILQPLKESRKDILDGTKVSQEEVEEQNRIKEKTNQLFITMQQIEQSTAFTEEQKLKITRKLILEYLGEEQTVQQIEEKVNETEQQEIA